MEAKRKTKLQRGGFHLPKPDAFAASFNNGAFPVWHVTVGPLSRATEQWRGVVVVLVQWLCAVVVLVL